MIKNIEQNDNKKTNKKNTDIITALFMKMNNTNCLFSFLPKCPTRSYKYMHYITTLGLGVTVSKVLFQWGGGGGGRGVQFDGSQPPSPKSLTSGP